MVSFSGEYDMSLVVPADDDNLLRAEEIRSYPTWVEVVIVDVFERETGGGRKYLTVRYEFASRERVHRQAYFHKSGLKGLLDLFSIVKLENSDQLVGRKLWLKFASEPGRGRNTGREFVTIDGYSLLPNDQATQGDDIPF